MRPEDQVPHPEVPAGHVISQRPAAGRVIRQGRRVNLIVSLGKDYFKAPDYTQKRLDEAQREILAASFRLGSVARIPSDLPRDTVLAQDPAPGRAIDRQGTISLLLSAGNEKRAAYMPDLRGMPVQQALQMMAGYGVVMTPRAVDAPNATPDVVLDQDPPPDTLIYPDTVVTYHVKAGAASESKSEFQNTIQHIMQQDWYSSALRVDLIDARGDRQVLLSAPPATDANSGLSGVAPGEAARRTRSAGGKITIPVRYTNEAMVEIYLDNRLVKSYYLKNGAISN
jgi:beta-lactam-binding protein with PASTA domain